MPSELAPKLPRPDREAPLRERMRYFHLVGAFGSMVEATRTLRQDPMEIVDLREDIRESIVDRRERAIFDYSNALDLAIYLDFNIPALIKRVDLQVEKRALVLPDGKTPIR